MSLLLERIDHLIETRHLVDLWRDGRDSGEITGLIAQRSHELVALLEINDDAEYDGLEVIAIEDVSRLRSDSRSLTSIQELMTTSATIVPDWTSLDLTSFAHAVRSVHAVHGHVGVHMEGYDSGYHIGRVLESDDDWLRLRSLGPKSSLDIHETLIRLEDVTRIEADGKYERRLLSLFPRD